MCYYSLHASQDFLRFGPLLFRPKTAIKFDPKVPKDQPAYEHLLSSQREPRVVVLTSLGIEPSEGSGIISHADKFE